MTPLELMLVTLTSWRDDMLVKLKNQALQGFNIFLQTSSGTKSFWLTPKESVMIEESSISQQIKNMVRKHLLKIERL